MSGGMSHGGARRNRTLARGIDGQLKRARGVLLSGWIEPANNIPAAHGVERRAREIDGHVRFNTLCGMTTPTAARNLHHGVEAIEADDLEHAVLGRQALLMQTDKVPRRQRASQTTGMGLDMS